MTRGLPLLVPRLRIPREGGTVQRSGGVRRDVSYDHHPRGSSAWGSRVAPTFVVASVRKQEGGKAARAIVFSVEEGRVAADTRPPRSVVALATAEEEAASSRLPACNHKQQGIYIAAALPERRKRLLSGCHAAGCSND